MNTPTIFSLACALVTLGLRTSTAQEADRKPVPAASGIAAAVSPLDADPRLNLRVTFGGRLETVGKVLALLSKLSGFSFQASDAEISTTLVSFKYKSQTLRDVCNSLSSLQGWRWRLDARNTWTLLPSAREVDAQHPHSESEAKLFRLGHEFLAEFGELPADIQKALFYDPRAGASQPGVSLGELPPSTRQIVNAMIYASILDRSERGLPPQFPAKQQRPLFLSMQFVRRSVSDRYIISVAANRAETVVITDFPVLHGGSTDNTIMPRVDTSKKEWQPELDDAQSRGDAVRNDPLMQAKISLSGEDVTLPQVMQEVASLVGIDYTLEPQAGKNFHKTFRFSQVPLYEVLDRLCALYDFRTSDAFERTSSFGYCWGKPRNGCIVFHVVPIQKLAKYRAMQTVK